MLAALPRLCAVPQVFRSLGEGDNTPLRMLSRAPNVTLMGSGTGSYRQVVVFEWHGVGKQGRLSVIEGVVSPSDGTVVINGSFYANPL